MEAGGEIGGERRKGNKIEEYGDTGIEGIVEK